MKFTDSQNQTVELPEGEKVGQRTSVYGVVFFQGKLLLYMPTYSSSWQLPGGGVEEDLGEKLDQALIRECLEETGYRVKAVGSMPIYKRKQNFYQRSTNRFLYSEQIFLKAELMEEEPDPTRISDQDVEGQVAWMYLDELNDQNIHPTLIGLLEQLKKSRLPAGADRAA